VLQAPAFTGEPVPMGPLKAVITTALLMRKCIHAVMCYLGLQQFAPHESYALAMRRCTSAPPALAVICDQCVSSRHAIYLQAER
jgi:hypothetical protein